MLKLLTALNCKLFSQKDPFKFASDYVFYVFPRFLQTTKKLYHGFLERWLFKPSKDFACSKLTIEALKTLEQDVKCV